MEGKPFMGEVELPRTPRKVKPAVQERLENTPKKSTTLEHIQTKLKTAEERRAEKEHDMVDRCHKHVEKAKQMSEARKSSPQYTKEHHKFPGYMEVALPRSPCAKKPPVALRLEAQANSPRRVASPDVVAAKLKAAEERRHTIATERTMKCRDHIERAKKTALARKLEFGDDENEKPQHQFPVKIEVSLDKTPRKTKPAIQERLESTPQRSWTPEKHYQKLKDAEERRHSIETSRVLKCRQHVANVKERALNRKLNFNDVDEEEESV